MEEPVIVRPQRPRPEGGKAFARLLEFTRGHGIELYVVNLPETVWVREGYRPGRYETYLRLVREALGETPLLDLRELLGPDEFQDATHTTRAGAVRVTDRVIQFIHAERAKRIGSKP